MRSLWLLAISFAALLSLIAIHGYTTMRRARTIHTERPKSTDRISARTLSFARFQTKCIWAD